MAEKFRFPGASEMAKVRRVAIVTSVHLRVTFSTSHRLRPGPEPGWRYDPFTAEEEANLAARMPVAHLFFSDRSKMGGEVVHVQRLQRVAGP